MRLPINRGASEARNEGLKTVSGKWVFFLDGDDHVESETLGRMAKDPSKYAHETGVYLRLRKSLAEGQADPHILKQIDSVELPGAVIRMATSAVLAGKEDLFWRIVRSRKLRKLSLQGLGAWKAKPEITFKALLFAFAPRLLLALYRRKAKHR